MSDGRQEHVLHLGGCERIEIVYTEIFEFGDGFEPSVACNSFIDRAPVTADDIGKSDENLPRGAADEGDEIQPPQGFGDAIPLESAEHAEGIAGRGTGRAHATNGISAPPGAGSHIVAHRPAQRRTITSS